MLILLPCVGEGLGGGFMATTKLAGLKAQKEVPEAEKNQAFKAKEDAEAKPEQLLKDKAKLKLLHQQVETDLTKLRASFTHVEKEKDSAVSEQTRLFGEVERLNKET